MKRSLPLLFGYVLLIGLILPLNLQAQEDEDDLMAMLEEMEEEPVNYALATFKGVRLINAHSIEMPGEGVLQMMISHRFGRVNGGAYEFFGLDQANMRLGFEYGIKPWLCVGIGRSNVFKTYDSFLKVRLFRQKSGAETFPFTIVAYSNMAINTLRFTDPSRENFFTSRLNYTHQLMIARKFGERLSLQLMPTMVHRNLVATRAEQNDVFAMGIGGRVKVTRSMTINFEYFYLLPGNTADNFQNSLSIGVDIETGGHVFQLMFTNSVAMSENLFIPQTTGDWLAGDIHLGFNLGRVFTVKRK
ncbi:MAG: DUF5777 family beta-barrel protein [Bacteroidota bacterium]